MTTQSAVARPRSRRCWIRFFRHYLEMVIAMFIGMGLLALVWHAVGLGFSHARHPEAGYLVMAFDMSVGMAVAMRLRGHRWRSTLQMCAVMFAPALPLFPLLWLGVIGGVTMLVAAHITMFPLMFGLMLLRRDEYTHCAG